MKKYFLFIFIVLVVSCNQKPETAKSSASIELFDEKTELDSIMHVIDNETKMFFAGNVEGWRASWSHKNYTSKHGIIRLARPMI